MLRERTLKYPYIKRSKEKNKRPNQPVKLAKIRKTADVITKAI